jgi:sulfur-oxidizing protein SoxY
VTNPFSFVYNIRPLFLDFWGFYWTPRIDGLDSSKCKLNNIFMLSRRSFLNRSALVFNATVLGLMVANFARAADEQDDKAAAAKDVASALIALGVQNPGSGKRILLDVPEIIDEKQNLVIKVKSAIPNTDWIAVLIDRKPQPFVGQFNLVDKATSIEANAKLLQTSTVVAIVRADGKYYRVDKEVKVAIAGSCG